MIIKSFKKIFIEKINFKENLSELKENCIITIAIGANLYVVFKLAASLFKNI